MKKTILSIIALLAMTVTAASAKGEVFLQGGVADANGTNITTGGIGYGFTTDNTSGLLFGTDLFFGGGSDYVYYGGDAHLGIRVGFLGIYGIGGCLIETPPNGTTSYGWTTGGGIEFKIDNVAFALENKTSTMDDGTNIQTKTKQTNLILKYRF